MNSTKTAASLAVAGALVAALGFAAAPASAADDMEKCYGVSAAGKNDCASEGSNSCAGTSKVDYDGSAWHLVKKGTCTSVEVKLKDGSTRKGSLAPIKG